MSPFPNVARLQYGCAAFQCEAYKYSLMTLSHQSEHFSFLLVFISQNELHQSMACRVPEQYYQQRTKTDTEAETVLCKVTATFAVRGCLSIVSALSWLQCQGNFGERLSPCRQCWLPQCLLMNNLPTFQWRPKSKITASLPHCLADWLIRTWLSHSGSVLTH